MSKLHQSMIRLGFLLTALALAGCGQRELTKKETYSARGRVLLNGAPAQFVMVQLTPEIPGEGIEASGQTDADGVFELRTYSNEEADGAVPGRYKVTLVDVRSIGGDESIPVPKGGKPTVLPQDLRGKEVASVEITAGDNDLGDIKVP